MNDRLNKTVDYRELILSADQKSLEHNLPHRALSYSGDPLQTAELKRCMMLGVAARNALTFTSKDPFRNAPDICLAVSEALTEAGFEHEVTLGNLIRRGKHLVSNVSARALVDAFQSTESAVRANYYCWITLNDGSVFDFALLSEVKPPVRAPIQKGRVRPPKPKKQNLADTVLMLNPTEHGTLYRYVPEIVGYDVLKALVSRTPGR
ncbi:hypothetical protein [Saccharospirillum impatiens]|uniref:hypothetical protein n=1 Tax=Saccharospirillum impatiens TaxID=169438 RepID=UPI0003F67599|nr:hypothetical protein [Saccharospirillum impatiens]